MNKVLNIKKARNPIKEYRRLLKKFNRIAHQKCGMDTLESNLTVPILELLLSTEKNRPGFIKLVMDLDFLGVVQHEEWLLKCIKILIQKLSFTPEKDIRQDEKNVVYDIYLEAFGFEPTFGRNYKYMPTNLMPEWKRNFGKYITPYELIQLIEDLGYSKMGKDEFEQNLISDEIFDYVKWYGELAIRRHPQRLKQSIDYQLMVWGSIKNKIQDARDAHELASIIFEALGIENVEKCDTELRNGLIDDICKSIEEKGFRETLMDSARAKNIAECRWSFYKCS